MIIPKQKFKRLPWLNGKGFTTQMLIHPPQQEFANKKFDFRISSAVLNESGPFSQFQNYHRWIVILQGNPVQIYHQSQHNPKTLKLNEPYYFSGNIATTSKISAKGLDLNMIVHDKFKNSTAEVIKLIGDQKQITLPSGINILYNHQEGVEFQYDKKIDVLDRGNLLFIRNLAVSTLRILKSKESELMWFSISTENLDYK